MTSWCDPLFEAEPEQWGLRGDPHLWAELRVALSDEPSPESRAEFAVVLVAAIDRLVGANVTETLEEAIQIDRYPEGGMSGGWIDPEFWRETGLPLLHRRFSDLNDVG